MSELSGPARSPRGAVRWEFAATIVGIAAYVVLDTVAQLLPPHYSPISQAESDLGVGPYGWVMNLNFVVRGVLSLALVAGLYRSWPSGAPRPSAGLALIGAWGAGALILAVAHADVSGPATVHGTVHLVTAFLAFLFAAVGIVLVSRSIPAHGPWRALRPYAVGISGLVAISLVVLFLGTGVPRIEHHWFGLLERIFLGAVLLWMLLVSIVLLRGEPTPPGPAPTAA